MQSNTEQNNQYPRFAEFLKRNDGSEAIQHDKGVWETAPNIYTIYGEELDQKIDMIFCYLTCASGIYAPEMKSINYGYGFFGYPTINLPNAEKVKLNYIPQHESHPEYDANGRVVINIPKAKNIELMGLPEDATKHVLTQINPKTLYRLVIDGTDITQEFKDAAQYHKEEVVDPFLYDQMIELNQTPVRKEIIDDAFKKGNSDVAIKLGNYDFADVPFQRQLLINALNYNDQTKGEFQHESEQIDNHFKQTMYEKYTEKKAANQASGGINL
jgi:hypothetical protein